MDGEDGGGGGGRDPSSLERGRKGRRDKKDKGYTQLDRASSEEDLLVGDSQSARTKKGVFGKKKEKSKDKDKRALQPSSPTGKQRKEKTPQSKGSTGEDVVDHYHPAVTQTRPVFGVPLADAVSNNRSHDGVPLPAVIRQCLDFVTEHGLETEGIYRVSAPKARLDELERRADAGLWLQFVDSHDAAGLLKRFLRQLPNHILTERLRDSFEKAATECPCAMNGCCTCLTGDRLKAYLRQLPACNYALVAYLFRHAQLIVSNEQSNKMSLAALGLVLQATLNMSQSLLRIFLMNASSQHAKNLPQSKAATFLFDDVEIKRYVSPQRPDRLTHNLPTTRSELEDELHKQQSRLQELHEEVASLRAQNISVAEKEQELWDVQMVATQLKRKLKSVKQAEHRAQSCDSEAQESTEKGPTIEMFEEKQLLAVHMELKEKLALEKQAIVRLSEQLGQQRRSSAHMDQQNQATMDDAESAEWQAKCAAEEKRRNLLLAEIIEERSRCARLRAEIELLAIQKRGGTSIITRL